MSSTLSISTFTDEEFNGLADALNEVIKIPRKKLKAYYKKWDTNISLPPNKKHWEDFFYTKNKKDIYTPLNADTAKEYEDSPLVGVDLPTFIGAKNNELRVMIVGLDPLRNCKDFPFHSPGDCIIGTPYAYHSRYYRQKKSVMSARIINEILNMKHSIYLTDVYKVWAQNLHNGKKISIIKEDKKAFETLLQREIDIIKPSLCITFGSEAHKFLNRPIFSSSMHILSFPHPAGTANGAWGKKLEGKCTDDNKVNYIHKKLRAEFPSDFNE